MSVKFRTGDTIEIELFNGVSERDKKIKTLVESSNGDEYLLIHSPIVGGRILLPQVNDRVRISFSETDEALDKFDVFTFNAKIVERKSVDNIAMIGVERTSDIEKVQRRDYFRLNYVKEMQVTKEVSLESVEVVSKDVSLGGMRFLAKARFEENEEIVCHINFSDTETISIKGTVIHCELDVTDIRRYQTRVKFKEVSGDKKSLMFRQMNIIQSRQLKMFAGEAYQKNMEEIMPHFNVDKIDTYKGDLNFKVHMGYVKGLIIMAHIINVAFHNFARPQNNYTATKLLHAQFTGGWSPQFLQFGMVLSIIIAIVSVILNYVIQMHYEDGRRDKLLLISAIAAVVMFCINLYQFIALAQ